MDSKKAKNNLICTLLPSCCRSSKAVIVLLLLFCELSLLSSANAQGTTRVYSSVADTFCSDCTYLSGGIHLGAGSHAGIYLGTQITASGIYTAYSFGYDLFMGSKSTTLSMRFGWLPSDRPIGILFVLIGSFNHASTAHEYASTDAGKHSYTLNVGWLGEFSRHFHYTAMAGGGVGYKYGRTEPFLNKRYYEPHIVPNVEFMVNYFF